MVAQELEQPVSRLPGVGPKLLERLSAAGYTSIGDLLELSPRDYEDRIHGIPIAHAGRALAGNSQPSKPDRASNGFSSTTGPIHLVTIVRILRHEYFGHPRKKTLKIHIQDYTGRATLVCFGRNFLSRTLTEGSIFFLAGSFTKRYGELQSSDFETEPVQTQQLEFWKQQIAENPQAPILPPARQFGKILPHYPSIAGLGQGQLRSILITAVNQYGKHMTDPLPPALRESYQLISYPQAIDWLHRGTNLDQIQKSIHRLAFQELFLLQLGLAYSSEQRRRSHPSPNQSSTGIQSWTDLSQHPRIGPSLLNLPFKLTEDQKEVTSQILMELQKPTPMARLLQGDVGSGKTLTAILCALEMVRQGRQVVFMAPTELLAKQHADTVYRTVSFQGVRAAFLSGSLSGKPRNSLLEALRSGLIDILIGTHAVFTQDVEFKDLGLAIIDEQHRFGVNQRQQLLQKGTFVHLLLMSATPIPRTLAMTVYGDLQISTILSKPAGRKPIETHLARMGNEKKVYEFVRGELAKGHQAYFVYPRIETPEAPEDGESEAPNPPHSADTIPQRSVIEENRLPSYTPLKSAEEMHHRLSREIYGGYNIGLIHGSLKEEDKNEIMLNFAMGNIQILVATTVVEVGVDVPNATCLVVEHAEAFGLSALHQLRGRVGRGTDQSYAFLVYKEPLTDIAKERLKILKQTNDGFEISEKDLELRGPGDLGGIQQSGFLKFRFADLSRDQIILEQTRTEARSIITQDPELTQPEHKNLRRFLD